MSQLDLSISFSHLLGLMICFYVFLHYTTVLIIQYWYNDKLRSLEEDEMKKEVKEIEKSIVLKKILKL